MWVGQHASEQSGARAHPTCLHNINNFAWAYTLHTLKTYGTYAIDGMRQNWRRRKDVVDSRAQRTPTLARTGILGRCANSHNPSMRTLPLIFNQVSTHHAHAFIRSLVCSCSVRCLTTMTLLLLPIGGDRRCCHSRRRVLRDVRGGGGTL